ncbi:MAG: DUF262 domain-containing protein [Alphaproteobacteria bacterium]
MKVVERTTIHDILEGNQDLKECHYTLTDSQREFVWDEEAAEELIDDLQDSEESLFLGTMIFYRPIGDDKKRDAESQFEIIEIVDGQQRITSLMLLLIACRECLAIIAKEDDNDKARKLISMIQKYIIIHDEVGEETNYARLIPSEKIKPTFDIMAKKSWDRKFKDKDADGKSLKKPNKKIKPIYEIFIDEMREYDYEDIYKIYRAAIKARIVYIEIEKASEIFPIFEKTNARGIELTVSEKLKNNLFSKDIANIQDEWKIIEKNAEPSSETNIKSTIVKMLRYFYMTKEGYIGKSALYKELSKIVTDKRNAPKLVDELKDFSEFYRRATKGNREEIETYLFGEEYKKITADNESSINKILDSILACRIFGVSQVIPLFYSVINFADRKKIDDEYIIEFFEQIRNYHFINSAICKTRANLVEKIYANSAKEYSEAKNKDDFLTTTKKLFNELQDNITAEEVFISKFVDFELAGSKREIIRYMFHKMYNVSFRYSKSKAKENEIEHWYPQSPNESRARKLKDDSLVDNIGNLLILPKPVNNDDMGNDMPEKKYKILSDIIKKDSSLNINAKKIADNNLIKAINEFLEYPKKHKLWNDDAIKDRAESLAEQAYKIWVFDPKIIK